MLSGRVLPVQALRRAIADGVISATIEVPKANIQPASVDLRFGEVAYRLRASFLSHDGPVAEKLADYAIEELDLRSGVVLEPRRPYLIPLREGVALPGDVRGFVNPKSSAGRVDTLCRALTDESDAFDQIRAGYRGPIYVEIVSRTFPLLIRPDMTFVQLRLFAGDEPFLSGGPGRPARPDRAHERRRDRPAQRTLARRWPRPLARSAGDEHGVVGYRAKRNTEVLDYGKLGQEWRRFWEPSTEMWTPPAWCSSPRSSTCCCRRRRSPSRRSSPRRWCPTTCARARCAPTTRGSSTRASATTPIGPAGAAGPRSRCAPTTCRSWWSRASASAGWSTATWTVPDFLYGADISSNYQGQINTLSKHFVRPISEPQPHQLAFLR
ncbi:MAG: 2'-deoxycytidine 5'-triphosphate deaminase [Acidimicrobiales bacterium]